MKAEALEAEQKNNLCKTAFEHMEFFNAVLREFEYVDLTFDLVISATCFSQLKRHRMATLTAQPYNLHLGVTLPPSIKISELTGIFWLSSIKRKSATGH